MSITEKRYNEEPYLSKTFFHTSAKNQNAILKMLGMKTEKPSKAKILEIGCSYGGNIIGTAFSNPDCEIIGIDLCEVHVKGGNELIDELGLKNIRLHHMNILDYNYEFGKFDYIICHGVYSWVPDDVREKILEVISKSLKKSGSALVSYNTYPAWKSKDILKDISMFRLKMLKKNGTEINKNNEVAYAKGALEFVKSWSKSDRFTNIIKYFMSMEDSYLYHEILESNSRPLYLYEFNKSLKKYGLTHVMDSRMRTSNKSVENEELRKNILLETENNHVAREQFYDLIYNPTFRSSIITHEKNLEKLSLNESVFKKDLDGIYISGEYKYDEEKDCYIHLDTNLELNPYIKPLAEKLTEIYPSNIKVKDLVKEMGEEQYKLISNLIIDGLVDFGTEKIKHDKKMKIKINDRLRNYLEISLKHMDKVSPSLSKINLGEVEIAIMLMFDGVKSEESIIDKIAEAISGNEDKKIFYEEAKMMFYRIKALIMVTNDYEEVKG